MSEPRGIELVPVQDEHQAEMKEPSTTPSLDSWLATLIERNGSDLLLVTGAPVCILVDGRVHRIGTRPLAGREIEAAVLPALGSHAAQSYRETRISDFSYRVAKLGRFRVNLHHEKGQPAASIRALPSNVPVLQDLRLPRQVELLSQLSRGLVLIGGPAGAGKSTTLAALIHEINRKDARHIVTIEDPIEYEHKHIQSIIEQVEIGVDAGNYPVALRSALRQAPDVIVIGEMRDAESMRIALAASETGHLVLSTLHATDVAGAVSRIADSFPAERQHTIRQELAMTLAAVLTQMLVPSKLGGRVPVAELLMVGYGARQHIRRNAVQHLHQEITMTRRAGSFTMEESLLNIINQGHIDREDALGCVIHPEELDVLRKR